MAFVEMKNYIPSGKSSVAVMELWLDTVSDTLNILHEMDDGSGCLVPPERDDTWIYNISHFPKMFCSWVKF